MGEHDETQLAAVEAALAAARAHERAGRLPEAIAQFDEAHRRQPSPALAERILRLRRTAATQLVTEAPATWPRCMPDPFPETSGVPEVRPSELTPDALGGAILHHGCLIVRGLLDVEESNRLRDQISRSMQARARRRAEAPDADDEHWYRPFDPRDRSTRKTRHFIEEAGGMMTIDAPPVMWAVLDILSRAGLSTVIAEYLQEQPVVSARKSVLRCVRDTVPTWHQDGSFMGADARSVDVWIALSACGPGTGAPGLDLLPMRVEDILDTQTHGEVHLYAIGQGLVDEVGAGRPWVAPHFEPGDAILFDERFVHRSSVGEEYTADRYAVETWFFGASSVPDGYVPILA